MHCSINQSDTRTACCQIYVPISVLEVNKNLSTKVFKMAGPNVPNRFHSTSKSEINFFKDKTRNQNTENSTNTSVNAFKEWAKSRQKNGNIASDQPEDLDRILQVFYVEVRKRNKEEYEPECLRVMRAGLERHLKERNYPRSLLHDDVFKESTKVLEGKARALIDSGKGNRPNRARALNQYEENALWDCGLHGNKSPRAIINTLWFYLTQHSGLRGRQEHYLTQITILMCTLMTMG